MNFFGRLLLMVAEVLNFLRTVKVNEIQLLLVSYNILGLDIQMVDPHEVQSLQALH